MIWIVNYYKSRPKRYIFENFEWFDAQKNAVSEDPDIKSILIFTDCQYRPIALISVKSVSYTKTGQPLYGSDKILKWAYVPFPKDKK